MLRCELLPGRAKLTKKSQPLSRAHAKRTANNADCTPRRRKAGSVLAPKSPPAPRHNAVPERQEKAGVAAAVEALHHVEHRLCHRMMFGEALRNRLRPELRFMRRRDANGDARGHRGRSARGCQVVQDENIRKFEQAIVARRKFFVQAYVNERT